jgi:type II secretory pathway predicted ATPase ExeA
MNGLPFQLSPDPDFYFDSHGHHRVLAALRRGLSEASGFTVITGEIGAGKTTAIRAVLRELKPEYFVVAQVVSTQLDSEELLRAISIGFGLSSAREGAMALTAGLRRFLAHLRTQRRRAVLVVDEAQNLRSNAFDELVGLAMRGAPGGRGMQVCLVGQPELQAMLGATDLLAVREQICVSCHLGPLEREETGPYVEHRLRKVGWKGGADLQRPRHG